MSKLITSLLSEEKAILKKALKAAKDNIVEEPKGRLTCVNKGGSVFFYTTDENGCKQYISKAEEKQIKRLLQKRYDHAVIREAEAQIKVIESFLKKYDPQALGKAYLEMNEQCRSMLNVYRFPDEVFARKWQAKIYKGNDYPFGETQYITSKGERVRSKTEILIANTLRDAGVPYRYEAPMKVLNGIKEIYPDFTILDVSSRKLIYWEHFGKMDNDGYREKAIQKLETYAMEGITPGNGLIVTFEDYKNPISVRVIREIVKAIT